ncbi:MAG: site-specific integrase, partial [Gemmatimonadetes bacterium]|nr:site-specific integrase [Gemmatimonadota bacterium]
LRLFRRRAGAHALGARAGRLAHSGTSSEVIMELAGHKHLSTTQRYISVNDEMKRAAVEVV